MIVDDHEVYRDGLRTVVESIPGFHVTAEAERVREAYAHMQRGAFDCVIVNLLLPGMSGLALVREVRRMRGSERILLVTMSTDLGIAGEALFAGVNGIVLKSDSRMVLTTALKRIMSGERYLSPALPVS